MYGARSAVPPTAALLLGSHLLCCPRDAHPLVTIPSLQEKLCATQQILQKRLVIRNYVVGVLKAHQINVENENGGAGQLHTAGYIVPCLEELPFFGDTNSCGASATSTNSAATGGSSSSPRTTWTCQPQLPLPLPPAATPETIASAYSSDPDSLRLPAGPRAVQDAAAIQVRRA